MKLPENYTGHEVAFLADLGGIEVAPDVHARIVINERTGTIVATSTVRVSQVAISHGSLTITVTSNLAVSQPNSFNESGQTVVTPSMRRWGSSSSSMSCRLPPSAGRPGGDRAWRRTAQVAVVRADPGCGIRPRSLVRGAVRSVAGRNGDVGQRGAEHGIDVPGHRHAIVEPYRFTTLGRSRIFCP